MKRKNLIINVIKMVIAFTIFYTSEYIVSFILDLFNFSLSKKAEYVLYSIVIYLFMTILLGLLYRKELKQEWKKFKSNLLENFDTGFKYYIIGFIGMLVTNAIIIYLVKLGQSQNEQRVQEIIKMLPITMLLSAGVFAPIIEELTFRKSLKNVFKNKWVFAIISGLLFGAAHIISYKLKTPLELLFILPYGTLGMSFALMDYETDSTFTSIFAHMAHNTVLTLLSIMKVLF